jgi:hypothetical protein
METSLKHFYFASNSKKQQKAETFLMLSTVISVLTICHGNHASASARPVLSLCREAWKDSSHWPSKRTLELFLHAVSCTEWTSFQNQLYLRSRMYWVRWTKWLTISWLGHYNRGCFQHCVLSWELLTHDFYCTLKWGGYLEGRCFQDSVNWGKSSQLFSCLKSESWLTCLVMRPGAIKLLS